jgi:hypothetical protein
MNPEPVNPLIEISETLASSLLKKLNVHESKVQTKYEYYNADQEIRDFGISTPQKMNNSRPGVGWASRAVNTLSDRVIFDGFANDQAGMNEYFSSIGALPIITKAKNDAFVAGCAFVAVADDKQIFGRKVLVPFTAQEATGELDQTTGLLRYGLAVTKWGAVTSMQKKMAGIMFDPQDYVVFTPDFTAVFIGRKISEIIPNETGRCLLHPITHRASADAPLGKSRLTNTVRRIIQEVGRLKRREEIAEEFYALPQRYISGIAEGADKDPNLDTAIGKVWTINKDEDGDKPDIGQLQQMSIQGFVDAKKDKARDFCAETGLTLRNLGYETGNPSSAESLAAMSDDLLLEAQNSQVEMGEQIKQIAITLRLATDNSNVVSDILKALVPAWKPIFQIDIGAAGDAMFKLIQAMPELAGTVAGYRMLGMSIREAEELQARRLANTAASFMNNGGGGS